jgi:hypothetical protein
VVSGGEHAWESPLSMDVATESEVADTKGSTATDSPL